MIKPFCQTTRALLFLTVCTFSLGCTFTEADLSDDGIPIDPEPTHPGIEPDPTIPVPNEPEPTDPEPNEPEPLPGLIGQWSFDENTGLRANDSTDGMNHGNIRNSLSTPWIEGHNESALLFGGNNDVSVPSTSYFQTSSVTLSAWIKVKSDFTTWGWIVGEGDNIGLVVNRYNPGDLHFYFYNGTNWPSQTISDLAYFDDQWHHVAATFNHSTKTSSMFFDGVLLGSKTYDDVIAYEDGSGVHIGSMLGERFFQGGIDEVQLYDRALSPLDITTLSDQ